MPDKLLARRAAAGCLQDFEAILHRYCHRVYRICYRMAGNAEDAQDWSQECFVRVYKQLGHYDPVLPFAPWFWRVVTDTCFNLAKTHNYRQSRLTPGLDENRVEETPGADPLETTLSGEEMRQVHAALAELAPPLRMAVTLRVLEGLSFHELAEALGVPLQAAASRVQRALTQVREQLEQAPSEMRRC
jgi:RNA polymerase sigma-70 factor, ECF subfamily